MRKQAKIWQPLIIALALVVGVIAGSMLNRNETQIVINERPSEHFSKLDRVGQILRYIDAKYVDSIDLDKLSMDAINAILDNLDPHSFFIPPSSLPQVNQQLNGSMNGIGIEYAMFNDTLSVLRVLPHGPAERGGLKAGDRILRVDSVQISGVNIKLEKLRENFYGKTGSVLHVEVDRYEEGAQWIKLRRGEVTFPAIENVIEIDSATLYVKVDVFSSSLYKEFIDSLRAYNAPARELNLILDLRNNTGGYLDEAIKILSQLIVERNLPLVTTRGYRSNNYVYKTEGTRYFKFKDIAILINEHSASASEIIAGAMQDYDLATIVGRRSYGKGLVQNQYSLSDGSAIRLTIARYYTPSGRLIQKPYGPDSSYVDYNNDILKRYERGELLYADSIPIIDSTEYFTRNGRSIYGGEGIVPDVFVPIDSAEIFSINLEERDKILACSFDFARKNRLFQYEGVPVYSEDDLDSLLFACLGASFKDKSREGHRVMRQIFMENLIFVQAGARAAVKYRLGRDECVKAAMMFSENRRVLERPYHLESINDVNE